MSRSLFSGSGGSTNNEGNQIDYDNFTESETETHVSEDVSPCPLARASQFYRDTTPTLSTVRQNRKRTGSWAHSLRGSIMVSPKKRVSVGGKAPRTKLSSKTARVSPYNNSSRERRSLLQREHSTPCRIRSPRITHDNGSTSQGTGASHNINTSHNAGTSIDLAHLKNLAADAEHKRQLRESWMEKLEEAAREVEKADGELASLEQEKQNFIEGLKRAMRDTDEDEFAHGIWEAVTEGRPFPGMGQE